MAYATQYNLKCNQYDIMGAFLNAIKENSEKLYAELPAGYKKSGKCIKILKAIYRLRDSLLLWYKELNKALESMGFISFKEESCLFYLPNRKICILFYVNDILCLYYKNNTLDANEIIWALKIKYEIKNEGGVKWFLGIRVIRDKEARKIFLLHDAYIKKIAAKFQINDNSYIAFIPMSTIPLSKSLGIASKSDIKRYQELIGFLLYIAMLFKPDIAFAVSKLSHFLANPGLVHFTAALRVLRYIWFQQFLSIQYGSSEYGSEGIIIASDASFADDEKTRKSSQGYIILLFGGLMVWKALKQSTVSTSTTEAEMIALAVTTKEAIAFHRFCKKLHLNLGKCWKIYCNN
jgi:hypothetical protein